MRRRTIFTFLLLISVLYSIAGASSMRSAGYIIEDPEILPASGNASSKDYILRDVRIGDMASGKAKSGDYILEAFPLDDETHPNAPLLNPVPVLTNNPKLLISGTKDNASSICINGYEVIPLNDETTWNYFVTLQEGCNYFVVTSKNGSGRESESTAASLTLNAKDSVVKMTSPDAPVISGVTPRNNSRAVEESSITVTVSASDKDTNTSDLWYRFFVNDVLRQDWVRGMAGFNYYISRSDVGLRAIDVEVADSTPYSKTAPPNIAAQLSQVYIFRKPILPAVLE